MALLPHTDLDLSRLQLGGNVFGWTADEAASFAVLDAFVAAGGNTVDTAHSYDGGAWGLEGGEPSESILGRWLARTGKRDEIVLATKMGDDHDLSPRNVRAKCELSLQRLGVDTIDLYYAHFADDETPLEEQLRAFDALVKEGKVRHLGVSNHTPERIAEALAVQEREGFAKWVVLQQHYNLMERAFEGAERELCEREGVGTLPYFSLAKGFLTGKYRPGGATQDTPRAEGAMAYMDERGERVLAALDEVAVAHDVPVAAVSLAWLAAQPTVVAPIASARSTEQLEAILPMMTLELSEEELDQLSTASATA